MLVFVARHKNTYFWTNTFSDDACTDHATAVARCKPLFDYLRRRGADFLFFWELTKKGRWHLHWIVDRYIDVNWFRAWLVERGWGQQMRVERALSQECVTWTAEGWKCDDRHTKRIVRYLTKYLTKSFAGGSASGCKVWGGPGRCRLGSVAFKWMPMVNARSYLYYWGRQTYFDLYGTSPTWRDMTLVMRLGYEAAGWGDVDPWFFDTS